MLNPGDRVAVVAPSHPFQPERLAAGCAVLRDWGLEVVEMANLHATYRYTAGTRAQRQADLRAALVDPTIDAVWYARGGSGTVHLLDDLPFAALDQRPVIGFSDATSLLGALWNRRAGRPIHGPVLHTLGTTNDAATVSATHRLLMEGGGPVVWRGDVVAHPTDAAGPLVGGNLCVMASMCGTPDQLQAEGCVLLLEEIGEVPYKIDRLVTQLRLSGVFEGVQAVVLGDFIGGAPPAGASWCVVDVIAEALHGLELPIVAGLPVGHGARNQPFMLGTEATVLRDGSVLLAPSTGGRA